MTIVYGQPVGKPTHTQRDRWKQRDCVLRYRDWADRAREAFGWPNKMTLDVPTGLLITAYYAIPGSWSFKQRQAAKGALCTAKPDYDNLCKAIGDALFMNDAYIASATITKKYDDGKGPRVEITIL